MSIKANLEIPLEEQAYMFKPHPNAPYRYYDFELQEYSEPGFLTLVVPNLLSDEAKAMLAQEGYTVNLTNNTEILVLDKVSCIITDAEGLLQALAISLN